MLIVELVGGPFDGQLIPIDELPKHYCLCHRFVGNSRGLHWPMIRKKVISFKDTLIGPGLVFEDQEAFDQFIEECDHGNIGIIFFEGKYNWLA